MTDTAHVTNYPQRELDRAHYLDWLSRCESRITVFERPERPPAPITERLPRNPLGIIPEGRAAL